jgi:hypothetical protein
MLDHKTKMTTMKRRRRTKTKMEITRTMMRRKINQRMNTHGKTN